MLVITTSAVLFPLSDPKYGSLHIFFRTSGTFVNHRQKKGTAQEAENLAEKGSFLRQVAVG